jgi:hypothetical protein
LRSYKLAPEAGQGDDERKVDLRGGASSRIEEVEGRR